MPDPIKVLEKAREEMVKARRDLADGLSKPYDPRKTPEMRTTFIEVQSVIDQINKAIAEEQKFAPPARVKGFSTDNPYGTDVPGDESYR
jgi:hypothetical protein